MSRYTNTIKSSLPVEAVANVTEQYLRGEGFALSIIDGQQVWKKGMGILTGPQMILVGIVPGSIRIEAWIKFALLPGVYVGEMGLDGFVGGIPKQALKSRVKELEKRLG